MVSTTVTVPIWTRGINFKAFRTSQKYTYASLHTNLSQHTFNPSRKKAGWKTDPTYLSPDSKLACFEYIYFKKNSRATNYHESQIYVPDGAGVMFDLQNDLIIPTITSNQKLNNIFIKKAFEPVRNITGISGFEYSGDFLFWLAYKHMSEKQEIIPNIKIEDITIISSGRDYVNLFDSIRATTDVTQHPESQVILGISGYLNSIYISIKKDNSTYNFNLIKDGRIQASQRDELTEIPQKYVYSKEIHDVLQKLNLAYQEFVRSNDWNTLKLEFQSECLIRSGESIKELINQMKSDK